MLLLLLSLAHGGEIGFFDAVRDAGTNTPSARVVDARADAVDAQAREDSAWPNPDISVRAEPGQARVEGVLPLDIGAMARGGTARATIEAAERRRQAELLAVSVAGGVAWLDARRDADLVLLKRRAEDLSEGLATVADERVNAGEWASDDGALLRADAASLLADVLGAELEAQSSMAQLSALLSLSEDGASLGVWPTIAAPRNLDPATVSAVVVADLDARAALVASHAERLTLIPTIRLEGGYLFEGETGPTYGASMVLPLFAPGAARVKGADARASGAAADADLARFDAVSAVRVARARLEFAERMSTAWNVPGLDDALDAAARRYGAGELSLPDYIARRNLAVAALQHVIDARWGLARARLAAWELVGELPTEDSP